MSGQAQETLFQEINTRLTALGEAVSGDKLKQLVQQQFDLLLGDKEFVRKMRFGGGSDPSLLGTKFSRWGLKLADVEWLYDILESARARQLGNGPSEELRNTFKALSDAVYIPEAQIREMDKTAIDGLFPRVPKTEFSGSDIAILQRGGQWQDTELYARLMRTAMDTAESGYGAQLVGAEYVGQLWEAARRESRIFQTLDTFEMTAPSAYIPVEVDFPEMLYVSESIASNNTQYPTSRTGSQRVLVTAAKFVIHQMWSGEMEEDSIIPFVPFLRRQATLSVAHYSDSVVLNGDTTNAATGNINSDDADPPDTKHYLAFNGIRRVGLVDNTGNQKDLSGAGITTSALQGAYGRMSDTTNFVDWGHPSDPSDLIHVTDITTGDKIALLPEVLTQDKYGPNATIMNGELVKFMGHPVIVSLALPRQDTDGKYTTTSPSTNDAYGEVVTYNRRGFKVGWRRRIKSEVERLPGTDQTRMVYSLRFGFGRFSATGAASGIEAADVIFDIA